MTHIVHFAQLRSTVRGPARFLSACALSFRCVSPHMLSPLRKPTASARSEPYPLHSPATEERRRAAARRGTSGGRRPGFRSSRSWGPSPADARGPILVASPTGRGHRTASTEAEEGIRRARGRGDLPGAVAWECLFVVVNASEVRFLDYPLSFLRIRLGSWCR
jgi:hypothetical protein